jgi:hypothetical protein
MSNFYLLLANTASRLLNTYGQLATVRVMSGGNYDAANSVLTPTVKQRSRRVALFDYPSGTTNIRGTLIKTSDKRCLLEARSGDELPLAESLMVIGNTTYTVVSAMEINPAGIPVLFDVHVSR